MTADEAFTGSPRPQNHKPKVHVVGAAILKGVADAPAEPKRLADSETPSCLVARRAANRQDGGLWEFPGGKVEPGESAEQALIREIREELSVWIRVVDFLGRSEVSGPARHLILDVYTACLEKGRPQMRDHDEIRWLTAEQIHSLKWAPADIPLLGLLRSRLMSQSRPSP